MHSTSPKSAQRILRCFVIAAAVGLAAPAWAQPDPRHVSKDTREEVVGDKLAAAFFRHPEGEGPFHAHLPVRSLDQRARRFRSLAPNACYYRPVPYRAPLANRSRNFPSKSVIYSHTFWHWSAANLSETADLRKNLPFNPKGVRTTFPLLSHIMGIFQQRPYCAGLRAAPISLGT